jgi:hypothetical protein
MFLMAIVVLMLAFAAALAWASWDEWRLSWMMVRNPSIMAVTESAIAENEAYLVSEMCRLRASAGRNVGDVWQSWPVVRDAFVEDDILPNLDPRLQRSVADPQSPIRCRINARIDSRVALRFRNEETSREL